MMVCEEHKLAEGQKVYPGQRCPWCERDTLLLQLREMTENRDKEEKWKIEAWKERDDLRAQELSLIDTMRKVCQERDISLRQSNAMVAENENMMLERNGFAEKANIADRLVGELQDFIYRTIDQHGFNVHTDEKCPEDDTCECPLATEANRLLQGYTERPVCAWTSPSFKPCTLEAGHNGNHKSENGSWPNDIVHNTEKRVEAPQKIEHCKSPACNGDDNCQCKCYSCLQIVNF